MMMVPILADPSRLEAISPTQGVVGDLLGPHI